jgi:hypothetical protein
MILISFSIEKYIFSLLFSSCLYYDLWYSGSQQNNENKPIELFTLVLFNNC